MKIVVEKEIYVRSKELRDHALAFFNERSRLNCLCCGFNFTEFYGKEIGDNFIEIHHIKPIFQYKGDDLVQTVKNAVSNIAPLCSNCHRMVHRHRRNPLSINALTQYIKNNGVFNIYT